MNVPTRALAAALAAVLACGLQGCATYRNISQLENGPGTEFSKDELRTWRDNQDKVLAELSLAAGMPSGTNPPTPAQWDEVIRAGMDFADRKCEDYLHALFRLNRDKRTTVSQIGLLGAASAGVLAALDVAARNVALTAIGFGLAASSVENLSSNLLFELDPSSVRSLVKTQQTAYRALLGSGYASRPAAMTALRGYAMLCVPANIEAEVNLAVKRSQPDTQEAKPREGQPPVVTNNAIVKTSFSFRSDDAGELLRRFALPGGVADKTNLPRLEDYLRRNGIAVSAQSFISAADFAAQREEAAKFFNLRK